jgi:hypothetical protein
MNSYIADFIPRLKSFSKQLNNLTLLADKEWVLFEPNSKERRIYIFRRNGELLISQQGNVTIAKWEQIGEKSILLNIEDKKYLLRHGFLDDSLLALKLDGKSEYFLFIEESILHNKIDSLLAIENLLTQKYISENVNEITTWSKKITLFFLKSILGLMIFVCIVVLILAIAYIIFK